MKKDVLAHYCIVRADLLPGVQMAQIIHAAGESSPGDLPKSTHAYALHARDENHLRDVGFMLVLNGIEIKLIHEPDAPFNGQLMSIGVKPIQRSKVKKLLHDLTLVK